MKRAIFILLALFAGRAGAEIVVEAGKGVLYTEDANLVLVGHTMRAPRFLGMKSYHQLDVGGWNGPQAASFAGMAKGVQWRAGNTHFRVSTGASLISETSSRLSTAFQFYEQFMVRYVSGGMDIAVSYRHWSNAFIKLPNYGMDFIGVQLRHEWR